VEIESLVIKVPKGAILLLEGELVALHKMEVFARNLYFQELRRFEGDIFETIKWLYDQEDRHAYTLQFILTHAGIPTKDFSPLLPQLGRDADVMIEFDIKKEEEAMALYSKVIPKATGALKEIVQHFYDEEILHIQRLKEHLSGQ